MLLSAPVLRLVAIFMGAMLVTLPASAEMIRFGYGGSIHGGATWEIRPGDSVTFAAYQVEAGLSVQPGWTWDNKNMQSGHIRIVVPGAFQTASAIMLQRIAKAKLGPAPAHPSNCTDAGHFVVEVDIPELNYTAMVDACIVGSDDVIPRKVLRHYRALKAATDKIHDALRLGTLF